MTKSNESTGNLPEADAASYAVMLPCTPETFGDFVSSLLGKPQSIEKNIRGSFEIDRDQVENLFHIVDQRVKQQNVSSLIQFVIIVGYDDSSSTRFNSFSDFQTYAEIRSKVSISLSMTWIYLISFPERPTPEKQEINVRFETGRFVKVGGHQVFDERNYGFSMVINHTVRSWGIDIEHLLTMHLESLGKTLRQQPLREWLGGNSGKIGTIFGFVMFFTSLAGLVLYFESFGRLRVEFLKSELAGLGGIDLSARAAILTAEEVFQGRVFYYSLYSILFVVVAAILSIIFGAMLAAATEYKRDSYLLLTRQAKEQWAERKSGERNYWWKIAGSLIGAIATGVVGNYVFAYLVGLSAAT